MLPLEDIVSNYVDKDVKAVVNGRHTQWRQACIRLDLIRRSEGLTEPEKVLVYRSYCERIDKALNRLNNGRIGKMPEYDDWRKKG